MNSINYYQRTRTHVHHGSVILYISNHANYLSTLYNTGSTIGHLIQSYRPQSKLFGLQEPVFAHGTYIKYLLIESYTQPT